MRSCGSVRQLPFTSAANTSTGWWVSGQCVIPGTPASVFARYEPVDPNTKASNGGTSRVVVGGVLPLTLPEYLRVQAEYWRQKPQAGGTPWTHHVSAAVALTF